MALPTAPLGQLPSMNMPYAIPTYEQGPSIWEKALGAFLVNAAGGVAGKLADNVLTRDEAESFGEKNATGFGRLLGPNVSPQEALQRRSQTFQAGENEKGRAFDADQLEQRLMAAAGQSDADAANARLLQDDRTQAGLDEQYLRDRNAGLRQDRDTAAALELDRTRGERQATQAAQDVAAARELEELRALLRAQDPNNLAQAERDRAAAEEARSRVEFSRQFLGSGSPDGASQTTTATAVDPSVAAFARTRSSNPGAGSPRARGLLDRLTESYILPVGPGASPADGNSPQALAEFLAMSPAAQPAPGAMVQEPLFRTATGEMVPRDQLVEDDPNGVLAILKSLFTPQDPAYSTTPAPLSSRPR